MTDFVGLIATLAHTELRVILVGGLAANVHGSGRLTNDVDVVYSRRPEDLAALVRALAPLEPYLRGAPAGLPWVFDQRTLTAGLNFTLTTRYGDLDLLGDIPGGGGFDALLPHTIDITLFGHTIRCLDLPTLIAVKRAAGRPKDYESVAELEILLEEQDQ